MTTDDDLELSENELRNGRLMYRAALKALQSQKSHRKQREKKVQSSVDGRSLRATGRTAQFNFKCSPEIKTRVHERADSEGTTVAEWMERAMEAALNGRAPVSAPQPSQNVIRAAR